MKFVIFAVAISLVYQQASAIKCYNQVTRSSDSSKVDCPASLDRCMTLEINGEVNSRICTSNMLCGLGNFCAGANCEFKCCEEDYCNSAGLVSANWLMIASIFAAIYMLVNRM